MTQKTRQYDLSSTAAALMTGIQRNKLFRTSRDVLAEHGPNLSSEAKTLLEQAQTVCTRIAQETNTVQQKLLERFEEQGLFVQPAFDFSARPGLQFHEFTLNIDGAQLGQALDILSDEGFAIDDVLKRKWRTVRAASSSLYLMAWDGVSTRLFLRWGTRKSGLAGKLQPNPADFAFAPIPQALWPLYYMVKPVRYLVERLTGQRTADRLGLKSGSFSLGTPHVLLDPLFDQVALSAKDTVVDLGCGDGRVLIAAAQRCGCKAIGVELNSALVEEARRAAAQAGVGDLVSIQQGSATDFSLKDVSVVFLFLPKDLVPDVLTQARKTAKSGTRILAHEQHGITTDWPPAERHPIMHHNAITVAHIWRVD